MTTDKADSLASQPGLLRFGLLVVCLGSLIGPLDTSVNVAFPMITQSFALEISDIQWIVASYIIVQSGLTLAFGQLGDLYGYRRVFRLGMAGCAVTHFLCSLAPTYPLLIAARVAQGITVGLAMACGPALATLLFAPQFRRPILALYVMVLGAGIALGPLIGGLLIDRFGWPSVFWYRAPWCLLVLLLTIWLPEPAQHRHAKPRFDFIGAFLLVVTLASLILLISMARRPESGLFTIALYAGVLVACAWGFVAHETRFEQPILHIRFLRDPSFGSVQLASVLLNLCGFSIFLLLPYVLDSFLRLSSLRIGIVLALSPFGAILAGFAGGWFAQHWSARRLLVHGMYQCAIGLGLLAIFIALDSVPLIGAALLLTGIGIGLFQIGFMDLTTATLPPEQRGVAGSLLNVTRVVGAVIGAASITWMLDLWKAIAPGLTAFQYSFGTLSLALFAFAALYGLLRAKPALAQ